MLLLLACSWLVLPTWADEAALEAPETPELTANSTIGWVPDPDGRGTLSLVVSCVVTLTLCVWSALHLNVPRPNSTFRHFVLEKTKWVVYGIFAPELVVATAAAQYITARWLKRQIEEDAAYRAKKQGDQSHSDNPSDERTAHTWSITQCFYATMGGFVTELSWPGHDDETTAQRVTITASGIRLLSFLGHLPKIDEFQIQDKSKADWMAKSIVCVQAGWMVAQVIGRLVENLPVSLLEINTCGHVACAMVLYLLWWSKPFDVQEPSILDEDMDALALMYLCSGISAVNDGINDIRCFHFDVSGRLPKNTGPTDFGMKRSPSFATTILSIGSPGSRDPSLFIGVNGAAVPTTEKATPSFTRGYSYRYHTDGHIAPECEQYLQRPYKDLSIRHGPIYCRRKLLPQRSNAEIFRPVSPALLVRASRAADMIWTECLVRDDYRAYYFTEVPQFGASGFFLGETEYLARYVVNFPSLSNLSLGQVNIHRDALRSVLALTAFAYGGLHVSAWREFFPSQLERILWIVAALTIASSGALLWAFFLLRQVFPAFDDVVSGHGSLPLSNKDGSDRALRQTGLAYFCTGRQAVTRWVRVALLATRKWALYPIGIAFVVARVFLVVEAFVSIREMPKEMYLTPEWTDFVPHL